MTGAQPTASVGTQLVFWVVTFAVILILALPWLAIGLFVALRELGEAASEAP